AAQHREASFHLSCPILVSFAILSALPRMRVRKIRVYAAIFFFMAIAASSVHARSPAPTKSEADKLDRQVVQLYQAGKYSEAIPIAIKILALREKALGPNHPTTAMALNNLAVLYKSMGD